MLTILNDLHLGARRTAGTTPQSSIALTDYLHEQFENLLAVIEGDLCILGDLFDGYTVPNSCLLRTYEALVQWLKQGHRLFLVAGNHDLSKDSTRLGSFDVLARVLASNNDKVLYVVEPTTLMAGIYAIPHVVNQEVFNLHLQWVPPGTTHLLLHCNYDNQFAVEADHSLNLAEDQARALEVEKIIIAHEHQGRRELQGKVVIPGNQFPSSVSDCLGNESKYLAYIDHDGEISTVMTWSATDQYVEVDWDQLSSVPEVVKFIRVCGNAGASEASRVVEAISKLRRSHSAFVITNAVHIGVNDDSALALPENLESATKIDVIEAVLEMLDADEREAVKGLLKETEGVHAS